MSTLPAGLVRFQAELEDAIRRETALSGAPARRFGLRVAATVVAAATAAAALGAFDAVRPDAPSAVERAAAALDVQPESILHVVILGRQDNGDGTAVTWRSESWQATSPPYARRQIEQVAEEPAVETASTNGGATSLLYDPFTNTIYRRDVDQKAPAGKLSRWRDADGKEHRVVVGPEQRPSPPPQPSPSDEPFRQEVLALLKSGEARESGRATIGGRPAVRIAAASGGATYFVDPETFDPIEFRTEGEGGGTALRFVTYEQLPLDAETDDVLSVARQHRGAQVSTDPAAYQQAQARLFPRG